MGVAASGVWGCSLWHVGLQPGLEPSAHMLPGAKVASNSARANRGAPAGCTTTQNSMPAELLGLLCTAADDGPSWFLFAALRHALTVLHCR